MQAKSAIAAALLLGCATAHQNFHQFWVNDVSPGYQVGIRMPPSNNPVTDVTSNDITCNVNGNDVPSGVSTVAVQAGDTIKVQWDSSTHPGPITHMLYGPVSDASQATGVGAWAKIDELDYVDGMWANEIMEAANMTHEFKLPSNLASGDYLLRSEMLALHGSQTVGGAQFYIGCAQIKVTGPGGSCSPAIQLPGAYNAEDSDIYIPNFYNGFDPTTYTAPGGPVATCGGSGGAVTSTTQAASTTTTAKTSTSTSVKSSSTTANSSTTSVSPTTTLVTSKTTGSTAASPTTTGTVAKYGQCGGVGYTGATACVAGSTCTKQNDYYYQCV